MQNGQRPLGDERLVEAALDFGAALVERPLIGLCRGSACTARQCPVPPRPAKLGLKTLVNRLERGWNVVAAMEFRDRTHRLMSEDAPCRGLDEGIEIVAKI